MVDQSARTLFHILRSTLYLVCYYRESEDGPKMRDLKLALGDAIGELEAGGADQPADPVPFAVSASWRFKERAATQLDKTA